MSANLPRQSFASDEAGAVSVDWVVLTAAVVGMGIASVVVVRDGSTSLAEDVEFSLTSTQVAPLGCLGSAGGPAGFECYAGPTITQQLPLSDMSFTPETCFVVSGGPVTCTGGETIVADYFTMSNGDTFTRQTITAPGTETRVVWRNTATNEVVDTPPPAG